MKSRAIISLSLLVCLGFSSIALGAYRTYLDPRSMAMGGTGVASSTKFNSMFHNPALIAFNRGDKPDKIHISGSLGARELYNYELEDSVKQFQDSDTYETFVNNAQAGDLDELRQTADQLKQELRDIELDGYRQDDMAAFSLLVDTLPVTIAFYTKRDIRRMSVIRNQDAEAIDDIIEKRENSEPFSDVEDLLSSSVDDTVYELYEFGVTVATTNVIDYNMPISWGWTPKLIEIRGSHIATELNDYDPANPPDDQPSTALLEWNLDIGFAMLLTDSFLENELGLDGWWLEGEWVFGMVGMNMFPTDFTPYRPARRDPKFPGKKRAVHTLYQIGLAHYREDFMIALDIDLNEDEIYPFEGLQRFVSLGGEYYWRDDFHLRAGIRANTAQTSEAGQDKAIFTGGFLYQPRGFSIEGSFMVNDVEIGGTVGFGLAF